VPTLISLACDNRKFLVYREGAIIFNEYSRSDDYPGESDGVHTVAANVNQAKVHGVFSLMTARLPDTVTVTGLGSRPR